MLKKYTKTNIQKYNNSNVYISKTYKYVSHCNLGNHNIDKLSFKIFNDILLEKKLINLEIANIVDKITLEDLNALNANFQADKIFNDTMLRRKYKNLGLMRFLTFYAFSFICLKFFKQDLEKNVSENDLLNMYLFINEHVKTNNIYFLNNDNLIFSPDLNASTVSDKINNIFDDSENSIFSTEDIFNLLDDEISDDNSVNINDDELKINKKDLYNLCKYNFLCSFLAKIVPGSKNKRLFKIIGKLFFPHRNIKIDCIKNIIEDKYIKLKTEKIDTIIIE